jgi:thioesterase domain-containing protein
MRRYKPGEYQGKVTLFLPERGLDKIFTNDHENVKKKSKHVKVNPIDGWGSLATEGVEVHQIPGNHFSILHEPTVQLLGDQLRQCIADARARLNGANA